MILDELKKSIVDSEDSSNCMSVDLSLLVNEISKIIWQLRLSKRNHLFSRKACRDSVARYFQKSLGLASGHLHSSTRRRNQFIGRLRIPFNPGIIFTQLVAHIIVEQLDLIPFVAKQDKTTIARLMCDAGGEAVGTTVQRPAMASAGSPYNIDTLEN